MKCKKNSLFFSCALFGLSFFSCAAIAGWCVPDGSNPADGVNVVEYGIGNTAYAGASHEAFGRDGNNGIYVQIKTPNGTKWGYPIDTTMNLNDPQGGAIVSTIKSALLTGARIKLHSDNSCATINAVAMMIQ